MSGPSAVQKQSLADVFQNRCQACYFIKKRLQHRCFPMKFTKSLRIPFFTERLYSDGCACFILPKKEIIYLKRTYCLQIMNIHLRISKHCWQYHISVTLHEKARSSRTEMFCKKDFFENLTNQRCFPVNFAKFSRTPFFIEHLRWLPLKS